MRILHVADTHLGMRQYGLEARRRDFSSAFSQVIDAALTAGVDAVVHAGDLFDNRLPSMLDLAEVLGQLQRLEARGIPFLGVVGNHESKRDAQWLDLFAQLGLAHHLSPETPFELGGVPIWGADFLGRNPEGVQPPRVDGGVLVMHQLVRDAAVSGSGELQLPDLYACGARLVLLGDYHEHRVWREGGVVVTYAGSTERASSAERTRRGFSILDWPALALQRRELSTRPYVFVGTAQAPVADPAAELAALQRQLSGAVVVIHAAAGAHTPRQLHAAALEAGALHTIVRRPASAQTDADAAALESLASVEQLDHALNREVERLPLGELARQIDALIRAPDVVDSHVKDRVSALLAEAGL